jgi:hypothetical protein
MEKSATAFNLLSFAFSSILAGGTVDPSSSFLDKCISMPL